MNKRFALMAGGPLMNHAPDGVAPGGAPAPEGGGNTPPANDFDKGYGKGVSKGERQVLDALGVKSVEEAKALAKTAADAAETQRKAAEKNGEFEKLYGTTKQQLDALTPEHAAYKAAYESTMAALTKDMKDEDKALLAGLPPDKAMALAQRLATGTGKPPVGAATGAAGVKPGDQGSGGHDLAWFAKKGAKNWTPEERAEVTALMAQDKTTVADVAARSGALKPSQ